jgi:heptosyltransferase-2
VVISLHKLGDSVCTIQAIREIVNFFSNSITIVCYEENVPIYEYAFKGINIIGLNHKDFYFGDRIASRDLRKIIKRLEPETIFDITGVMTSATLIFNQRAKRIIGFNREQFKSIYDYYSTMRTDPHLIDIYLDAVSTFLPVKEGKILRIFPVDIVKDHPIAIHPFAGVKSKEWSLRNFISLADRLQSDYVLKFIVHPDSLEHDIIVEIKKHGIPVIITSSTKELMKELKNSSLLISNDAGPIHVANLLGKATFSIFGPSNPKYSLPIGKNNAFIKSEVLCSPVHEKYCFTYVNQSCPSNECMKIISIDEVERKIRDFITELGIQKRSHPQSSS